MKRWKLDPHWQWYSRIYRERPRYYPWRWLAILMGKWMMNVDPTIHCFKVTQVPENYYQPRYPEYAHTWENK